MNRHLLLLSLMAFSLSCGRLLQSQELSGQAFANNLGNKTFVTQVEANLRSDTEHSNAAGYNSSTGSSNSDSLAHGQIAGENALAGTETVAKGTGKGLSQTQNETYSREKALLGKSKDELTAFLAKFNHKKVIRSYNGVATDGYDTTAGAYQKIRNEGDSTKKVSGADGTARYGSGVAGQQSANRYAGQEQSARNDASITGENLNVNVKENLHMENGDLKIAAAAFADAEGENAAAASSSAGALDGNGVISGVNTAEAHENVANAKSYVTSNPPRNH